MYSILASLSSMLILQICMTSPGLINCRGLGMFSFWNLPDLDKRELWSNFLCWIIMNSFIMTEKRKYARVKSVFIKNLCVLSFGILEFSCCPWSIYTVAFLHLINWLKLGTTLDFYFSFAHSLLFLVSFSSFLYSDEMCMCRKESFVDFMLHYQIWVYYAPLIIECCLKYLLWNR